MATVNARHALVAAAVYAVTLGVTALAGHTPGGAHPAPHHDHHRTDCTTTTTCTARLAPAAPDPHPVPVHRGPAEPHGGPPG